jgi:cytochrome P450
MVDYNPFARLTMDNPYPVYRQLRDEAPVHHNEDIGFWALSRFDDVMAAHLDPDTFISSNGITIEGLDRGMPFLIVKDPPEHTWHRKIVSRVFTPRRVSDLEPFIRSTAAGLLDVHRETEGFDVASDFAVLLPLRVIGELIGIPEELRDELHAISDRVMAPNESGVPSPDALAAQGELFQLLLTLVQDRRRHLGDDVVSLLIRTEVEDDNGTVRSLGDDELAYRMMELAFAGHETVAKLIPNGVVALAWYPDQRRQLSADPGLIPQAVEEMLRWDPPSHIQGRWSSRDVELHGVTIPADQRVVLLTAAATHDERRFVDAELFDVHRRMERHVSFGFGAHLCLGAALARLETRIAFEELLRRYPDYGIAGTGIERAYSGGVRGLRHLPLLVPRPVAA